MIDVQAEQAAVLTPLPFLQKLCCMRQIFPLFFRNYGKPGHKVTECRKKQEDVKHVIHKRSPAKISTKIFARHRHRQHDHGDGQTVLPLT